MIDLLSLLATGIGWIVIGAIGLIALLLVIQVILDVLAGDD